MKKRIIPLLCTLLAIMILVSFSACGSSKSNGKKSGSKNSNLKSTDYISLYEYAKELEKNGNSEAAAAVYDKIAEGGGAEFIQKAHEDNSIIKKTDEVEQVDEIFDDIKGGNGK